MLRRSRRKAKAKLICAWGVAPPIPTLSQHLVTLGAPDWHFKLGGATYGHCTLGSVTDSCVPSRWKTILLVVINQQPAKISHLVMLTLSVTQFPLRLVVCRELWSCSASSGFPLQSRPSITSKTLIRLFELSLSC